MKEHIITSPTSTILILMKTSFLKKVIHVIPPYGPSQHRFVLTWMQCGHLICVFFPLLFFQSLLSVQLAFSTTTKRNRNKKDPSLYTHISKEKNKHYKDNNIKEKILLSSSQDSQWLLLLPLQLQDMVKEPP